MDNHLALPYSFALSMFGVFAIVMGSLTVPPKSYVLIAIGILWFSFCFFTFVIAVVRCFFVPDFFLLGKPKKTTDEEEDLEAREPLIKDGVDGHSK